MRFLGLFAIPLIVLAANCGTDTDLPESDALSAKSLRGGAFALGRKEVILTFDDGPSAYSAGLADRLAARGVPATFFMVGTAVARRPEAAAHIASLGFSLGNHTYNHPQRGNAARAHREFFDLCRDALQYGDGSLLEELNQTHQLILRTTGVAPGFLRTPGGSWLNPDNPSDPANPCSAYLGPLFPNYVGPVNWDVGGGDAARGYLADHGCSDVDGCVESYMRELASKDGKGIILMHDAVANTSKPGGVADRVVSALLAEGYTIKDMRGSSLSNTGISRGGTSTPDLDPGESYVPTAGSPCGGPSDNCIWSAVCANSDSERVCVTKGSCKACGADQSTPSPEPGDPCGTSGNCIWSSYCARGGPLVCSTRGACVACAD